jgi:hypothetical protein
MSKDLLHLKRLQDISEQAQRPIWMPIGRISTQVNGFRLEIEPNPYVAYKYGHRKEFNKQFDPTQDYSLIGHAGAKLDLRFGERVFSSVAKRDKEAPVYALLADLLGSAVNYHPDLIDNFELQQLIGCLWDSGFTFQGQVVWFVVPDCPEEISKIVYKRHFDVALKLGLVKAEMFDFPTYVKVKRQSVLHERTLTVVNEMRAGEISKQTYKGIINVDGLYNVNYLSIYEADFSEKESDFDELCAFDCDSDKGRQLFRLIFMDEELIFHPETGEISAPEWVFIRGRRRRNTDPRPIMCTPVLQECLRAQLDLPPISGI